MGAPSVTYYGYLDTLRDALVAQYGGSSCTVVIGSRFSPYTERVIHIVPSAPCIEYERLDARTKTHRAYNVWYHCKIMFFNYILDYSLEGATMGITGKDGVIKTMEAAFEFLEGNFLELAAVRECVVSWGDPAVYEAVLEDGENNYFAAGGELIHKIRLRAVESEEQQASPPEITNIDSTDPDMTSITITFNTDKPGTTLIAYGTNVDNLNLLSTHDETLVTSHSITLTGLSSGTRYYLKPRSRSAELWWGTTADRYTFLTATGSPPTGGGDKVHPYV